MKLRRCTHRVSQVALGNPQDYGQDDVLNLTQHSDRFPIIREEEWLFHGHGIFMDLVPA